MNSPAIREVVASDGYRLFFQHWPAAPNTDTVNDQGAVADQGTGTARGIVIALHGIQSHSGWYAYSAGLLAAAGYDVYFADRRGSGLNGLERGHAAHAMRLVNDVRCLTQLAISEHAGQSDAEHPRVTILGISWGGKIAAAMAALYPDEYHRLALLYPGLASRLGPKFWQRLKLRFARDFEIVGRNIPLPLEDPALFTESPEWQQFIVNDPLALHTVTSSFLNAGFELDRIVRTSASCIRQPSLLMLAGRDAIIDNEQVRQIVNSFGSRRCTTLLYPEACHTLEFEADRAAIFTDLIAWMNASP